MPRALNWYGCEYCDYKSISWEDVREHEENCFRNPDNPFCDNCKERNHTDFGNDFCRKYEKGIYCCGINHWNAYKCKECLEDQKEKSD